MCAPLVNALPLYGGVPESPALVAAASRSAALMSWSCAHLMMAPLAIALTSPGSAYTEAIESVQASTGENGACASPPVSVTPLSLPGNPLLLELEQAATTPAATAPRTQTEQASRPRFMTCDPPS